MIGGTQWVVVGSRTGHVLRWGRNRILTRLLVPEMFGLLFIANAVGDIIVMLAGIRLRQAVVSNEVDDEPAFLNTACTMQVAQGLVL